MPTSASARVRRPRRSRSCGPGPRSRLPGTPEGSSIAGGPSAFSAEWSASGPEPPRASSARFLAKFLNSVGPPRLGLGTPRAHPCVHAPLRPLRKRLVFPRFAGHISSELAADHASGMPRSGGVDTACRVGPHAVQTPCRWSEDRLPGDLGCSPGNRKERLWTHTDGPMVGPTVGPMAGPTAGNQPLSCTTATAGACTGRRTFSQGSAVRRLSLIHISEPTRPY